MKNFEEWFQSEIDRNHYSHEENDCRIAWNACKQEILGVLEKNKHTMCSHGHDAGMEYVEWEDIEKIIKDL